MQEFERGFRIDGVLIDWGTTLATAAEMAGVQPGDDDRIGYSTQRVRCSRAYGFDMLAALMTSYGLSRPVTSLAYELSPPAGGETAPDFWRRPITHALGPATRESIEDVSGRPNPWDSVRYYANWDGPDVSVGLSIYGALREIPEGRSAGTLWLNWSTELAAIPYQREWRAACESLAVAAKGSGPLATFVLGLEQNALYGEGGEPSASVRNRREAQLVLGAPEILDTPRSIADRLSAHAFALWENKAHKLRCISTRWDSVIWDDGAQLTVGWDEVQPAKGPGSSNLHIGQWRVRDFAGSQRIAEAAAALEAIPGVTIKRTDGYDC